MKPSLFFSDSVYKFNSLTKTKTEKPESKIYSEPVETVEQADDSEFETLRSNDYIEIAEKRMMEGEICNIKSLIESSVCGSWEDIRSILGVSMSAENLHYLSIHEGKLVFKITLLFNLIVN